MKAPGYAKAIKQKLKKLASKTIWAYSADDLIAALRKLGIRDGDVMMVHASYIPLNGFKGTPQDLIDAFLHTIGPSGTLAMMAMPYHGISSYEYLQQGKIFDVRRSVSMVGIVSEVFRRRPGVIRSPHPTHSIAAVGPKAEWLLAGASKDFSPFGEDSPFDRLVRADGKILLYDVPFNTMTFEHYLEHCIKDSIPVPIYRSETFEIKIIDMSGNIQFVKTITLSDTVSKMRHSEKLRYYLVQSGALVGGGIGRSKLELGYATRMLDAVMEDTFARHAFHR